MAVIVTQMTTARVPFGDLTGDILVEGDRFERVVAYDSLIDQSPGADPDGPREPVDFTGWAPKGEVRDTDGALLAEFVITPSAGDSTGIWLFVIDPIPTEMVGINPYDMQIENGSGSIKTLQLGKMQITAQETV